MISIFLFVRFKMMVNCDMLSFVVSEIERNFFFDWIDYRPIEIISKKIVISNGWRSVYANENTFILKKRSLICFIRMQTENLKFSIT